MIRIRIVQCLCGHQDRHTILAMGVNVTPQEMTDAEAIAGLRLAVDLVLAGRGAELGCASQRVDPWCGLCGAPSSQWQYELGWSVPFPDWDTALRQLRRTEASALAYATLLELLDATYNARVRREVGRHVDDAHRSESR